MTLPPDPDLRPPPGTPGATAGALGRVLHLRAAGVSLVVQLHTTSTPTVLHWGADLGDLSEAALADLALSGRTARANNDLDEPQPVRLLPEQAWGWNGRPGLSGHRAGTAWSTRFAPTAALVEEGDGGGRLVLDAVDAEAGLALTLELELLPSGLLRHRATLTNTGAAEYEVADLALALPVPPVATEVFDLAGRWAKERVPQRRPLTVGAHVRENRRGRTGPDAPLVLAVGTQGFGFRTGEVWATHTAFSGNHRSSVEKLSSGTTTLAAGELLLPGEVRLASGEGYRTPWVFGAWSDEGLDGIAARFHRHLRARPHHPPRPRPVVVNTWEAVYFDLDLERLLDLARAAAQVGAERYVLDDGWFRHRRSDDAGLGDWYVDEGIWPQGLHPLVDGVRALGLEFGLWVEPEMVNPDSDLVRAHPDWVLRTGGRTPLPSRQQQVLDLGNPDAYAHVLARLDAILTEYEIAYLKWDHNRDLLEAGSGPSGRAGVHAQTLAVYRLLDELRARHPGVEIESCSSGGLRVDLEILEHTDRVWGSDCLDPLERQQIQRWTTQLVPPELIGSHVGASPSHTTHRSSDLSFRAGTALFASFGVETDLTRMDPAEREELARWVALYKEVRELLHTGTLVRADDHDPSFLVHGTVAPDGGDGLFAVVQLGTPDTSVPGRVRLPGLSPQAEYEVSAQAPGDVPAVRGGKDLPWLASGVRMNGRTLAAVGVAAPALQPQQLVLLRTRRL
ncbi:alpha-galactosidase [Kineococcus radiotolerans]|uniref:Alpha-galactosidase n=1 Tax=Kineococcus radiotolerans TaxID=131568 RepID=A0A7W4TMQ3_KINRA|nr:alpha-galactosidase [Kineococcus radiotolerans]MBB2901779.1 alpha-galactosidase [Kineococcus radiotolerans]